MADLEVVAEYLVEPDLERPDPGALPFELLQSGDPVAGGPRAVHDAVELLIEACPKHAAVLQRRRHFVGECGVQGSLNLVQRRGGFGQGQLRPPGGNLADGRQCRQCFAQCLQVARRGQSLTSSGRDPLQVWKAFQLSL